MFEKLVCLLALAAGMLIADLPKLGGTGRGERLLYGALCAVVLYLAVIFVTDAPLPNLDMLFDRFQRPAELLVRRLNPAQS
ncbi:hypothetical protein J4772_14525 [Cohnella sp. LGH]|uniref:hypothetical protein n=1 Tax=Cohnella sp. LGH TaxID=1619153 RepID=UPI001ADAA9AE|nr:hypothetical protein [Cohnella sp. LGH]QTH45518.1 hypothetical protein J4772_14525 [Cohnella sp. LGH]